MDFLALAASSFGAILALIVVFIVVTTSWIVVNEKTYVTTTLFGGKFYKTYNAGLHLKMPWPIEGKDRTVSLQIQEMEITVSSVTSDGAQMGIKVKAQYSPNENKLYQAAYVLSDPQRQVQSYLEAHLRREINGNTVQGVLRSKSEISERIKAELAGEFDNYGYDLRELLVDEPHLSGDMRAAMERKLLAERNLDAAKAEGELEKVKRVARAQADAEALTTKTKGFVDARAIMAKGSSDALNEFVEGIHDQSITARDALAFFNALDMREALRDASINGGKTVFISGGNDLQMNNLVGAMHSDHNGQTPVASTSTKA